MYLTCVFLLEVPPECNTYNVLSGVDRSARYMSSLPNVAECDSHAIIPAWYRFKGAAGDRMVDVCVPTRRCATHAPGWINGNHPTVDEGVVTRQVCFHWRFDCCIWKSIIKVRNCGTYFVYYLQGTPICYLRYCGNGKGKLPSLFLNFCFCWLSVSVIRY